MINLGPTKTGDLEIYLPLYKRRRDPTDLTIHIDYLRPLDPKLVAPGRNLGVFRECERSKLVETVRLDQLKLISFLEAGESRIKGTERFSRLRKKSDHVLLGAEGFLNFMEYQHKIPPELRSNTLVFDGTIFSSEGHCCVAAMEWNIYRWRGILIWLADDFYCHHFSVAVPYHGGLSK